MQSLEEPPSRGRRGLISPMEVNSESFGSASTWVERWRLQEFVMCILFGAIAATGHFFLEPFKQVVHDRDPTLMYPFIPSTVPEWADVLISGLFPAVIIVLWCIRNRLSTHAIVGELIGLLESILLVEMLVSLSKNYVGRPRPDFFARAQESNEARRSFPSGHASLAFSGLFFLSLWLVDKSRLDVPSRTSRFLKLFLCFSPCLVAAVIGMTRLRDYHHHAADVVAGALIGIAGAILAYKANATSPSSSA